MKLRADSVEGVKILSFARSGGTSVIRNGYSNLPAAFRPSTDRAARPRKPGTDKRAACCRETTGRFFGQKGFLVISELRKRARARRWERFQDFLSGIRSPDKTPFKIMDIGGTVDFWQRWWSIPSDGSINVELINNHHVDRSCADSSTDVQAITNVNKDAMLLTKADFEACDLIFSNSFFEHLGSREDQFKLAREIVDSNRPYFIQIPNKYSLVDPHHPLAPFFAVYPRWLRIELVQMASFGISPRATERKGAEAWQSFYNPLGRKDLHELFPDSTIDVEYNLAIPMSLIAKKKI